MLPFKWSALAKFLSFAPGFEPSKELATSPAPDQLIGGNLLSAAFWYPPSVVPGTPQRGKTPKSFSNSSVDGIWMFYSPPISFPSSFLRNLFSSLKS